MELRQLAYVEAVARHGHFTAAARELHVAQPAISTQVRRLERELGVALFERTTRRVALTEAGEVFLRRARAVLGEVEGARSDLADLAAVLRGRLHVGATPVLGGVDLPDLLAGYHGRYPEVDLAVRTGLVDDLLAALGDGTVDVVLGPIHDDLSRDYSTTILSEEAVVLIGAPGTFGRRRGTVPLREVSDRPFACLPAGTGLHAILLGAATAQGFTPRIQFEATDPRGVRQLVSAGLGVALVARSAADEPGPPVDVRILEDAPTHPPIGLIGLRRRRSTPAVRAWREHVTESQARGSLRTGSITSSNST